MRTGLFMNERLSEDQKRDWGKESQLEYGRVPTVIEHGLAGASSSAEIAIGRPSYDKSSTKDSPQVIHPEDVEEISLRLVCLINSELHSVHAFKSLHRSWMPKYLVCYFAYKGEYENQGLSNIAGCCKTGIVFWLRACSCRQGGVRPICSQILSWLFGLVKSSSEDGSWMHILGCDLN